MKRVIKHITIAAVVSIMSAFTANAQNSSTAVMEIRAEVISGASIERNDVVKLFELSNEEIAYGEFTMTLPEGLEVLTSTQEGVEMNNGTGTWVMNSQMNVQKENDGKLNFKFSTKENQRTDKGLHTGIQIATIEYL